MMTLEWMEAIPTRVGQYLVEHVGQQPFFSVLLVTAGGDYYVVGHTAGFTSSTREAMERRFKRYALLAAGDVSAERQ